MSKLEELEERIADPDAGLELKPDVEERLTRSSKLPRESLITAADMRKQLGHKATEKKYKPTKVEAALGVVAGPVVAGTKYAYRHSGKPVKAKIKKAWKKYKPTKAEAALGVVTGPVIGGAKYLHRKMKNPNTQVEAAVTAPYKQMKIGD